MTKSFRPHALSRFAYIKVVLPTLIRLFTAPFSRIFFSIVEPADRIAKELDASAKGRLDWVGGEV